MERVRGTVAALVAAALFGASAPAAKLLLGRAGPLALAGLLYLGAGVGVTIARVARRGGARGREAALGRGDAALVAGVIALGGVAGPVLLLVGLARVSAVAGSLLLNLEAVFTVALAALVFREHLSWRAGAAAAVIVGGALVLGARGPATGDAAGVLAIAGACACWGLDNNWTQRLSVRDPFAIAQVKTLAAGACNLALAVAVGEHVPRDARTLVAALGVGLLGYGVSLVLDVYALRLLGAAREAAYFATAPFVGALVAVPLVGERLRATDWAAGALMAAGVALLARERHAHVHTHDAIEHDHAHTHDDGHHDHTHPPGVDPRAPHAHPHRHEVTTHAHRHAPDVHHRHKH
jgi:drug/metabolite transporter (DMT)-like permease